MIRLKAQPLASTWRRVAPRPILPAAGLLLLGACAALGPPGIKSSRTYQDVDPQALYERTVAALWASKLNVTATDPASRAATAVGPFEGRDWAECSESKIFVEDSEDRHHLVAVPDKDRRVELRASVSAGPQGATLTLDPTFTAKPVSRMATTPQCRTTGVLEHEIFDAVAKT
jgi:hypothetical protein